MGFGKAWQEPRMLKINGLYETASSKFIAMLNYGFVALKNKKVCVIEGYLSHTFHIVLPKRNDSGNVTQTLKVTDCSRDQVIGLCAKMRGLADAILTLTTSMRQSVSGMITKVFRLMQDINKSSSTRNRQSRGLINL